MCWKNAESSSGDVTQTSDCVQTPVCWKWSSSAVLRRILSLCLGSVVRRVGNDVCHGRGRGTSSTWSTHQHSWLGLIQRAATTLMLTNVTETWTEPSRVPRRKSRTLHDGVGRSSSIHSTNTGCLLGVTDLALKGWIGIFHVAEEDTEAVSAAQSTHTYTSGNEK